MTDKAGWNRIAKSMHWLIALFIFVAATLGWIAHESAMSPGKLQLFLWHKSVGISVLGLMILRLVWRLTQRAPDELSGMTAKELKLASIGHWVVYAFAILMPLSGWILNSAANYPFRWFGLFEVPMLMDASKDVQAAATRAHLVLFWILALLVAGHVLMAVKHHLAGIPLLSRMLPKRLGLVPTLALLVGLSLAWVGVAYKSSYSTLATASAKVTEPVASNEAAAVATKVVTASAKTAPLWALDAQASSLKFIGTYDEIEFEGGFSEFSPTIHFDTNDLSGSSFDVAIQLTSVATGSVDRDELLPNQDWFWFEKYQQASYIANSFEEVEPGRYKANGMLDLKGVNKLVVLEFDWVEIESNKATLTGEALMSRTDFGIGAGYWTDDPTVGFQIRVLVDLTLTK